MLSVYPKGVLAPNYWSTSIQSLRKKVFVLWNANNGDVLEMVLCSQTETQHSFCLSQQIALKQNRPVLLLSKYNLIVNKW